MRVRCSFETRATPEQVLRAYTDFSDRRLETWRDTLRPENYRLRESGDSWAVVREGGLRMGVVLRYEWSEPDRVRWSILESNFCEYGSGELTVRPAVGGGAHVEVLIEEGGGKGALGRVALRLKELLGPSILRRSAKRTVDRLADERRPSG